MKISDLYIDYLDTAKVRIEPVTMNPICPTSQNIAETQRGDMMDIKPCPFCNSATWRITHDLLMAEWYVGCDKCKASGPKSRKDEALAVELWNCDRFRSSTIPPPSEEAE